MNFKSFIILLTLQCVLPQTSLFGITAEFTVSIESPCAPSLVEFRNESSQGAGIEYLWNFGKGALISSNELVLYEAYTEPGEYEVSLQAIENGDTVAFSQNITIVEGPEANFTVQTGEGCIPFDVFYSDNSTPGDADITSYLWDFRNGDTGVGSTISYTYNSPGSYGMYLEVTDANGCTSFIESIDLIQAYDSPEVGFSPSDSFACDAPLEVIFTNLSSGFGVLSYNWDYGNGQSSTNFQGISTYSYGTYDVSLKVTDQHDCSDSLIKENLITVGSATGSIYATRDSMSFTSENQLICPGEITLHSTLPVLNNIVWEISYSGITQVFEDVQEVDFPAPDSGRISILLRYNEDSGCGDTLYRNFLIDHIKADFEMDPDNTCQLPIDVEITNTSENAANYTWILPDRTISTQTHLNHTLRVNNSYSQEYTHHFLNTIRPFILIAENENGCMDTIVKNPEIKLSVARFMPDTISGCVPLEITFSDSSKSYHPITEWTWLIDGNEITKTNDDPLPYLFETAGNYPIRLAIENDQGCLDTSYTVLIHLGQKLLPDFSVDPIAICPGESLFLYDESSQQELIESWHYASAGLFNTGSVLTPDVSVLINSGESGPKDVRLTIESNGCLSDTVLTDVFSIDDPNGDFEVLFDCGSPMAYDFVADVEGADNFSWRIDGLSYPESDTLKHVFGTTGDYLVELIINNTATSCSVIKSKIIPVRNVFANFTVNPVVCLGQEIELNASNSIDYINSCYNEGFLWDFGDDSPPRRNYTPIQNHSYSTTGKFSPRLIVTAINGCTDTIEVEIDVTQPDAGFSVLPQSGCGPELEVDFSFDSYNSTIDNWVWNFGDQITDYNQNQTPSHTYTSAETRIFTALLTVEDIYGCTNTQTQTIEITVPVVDFHAVRNGICLGEEAQFIISDSDIDSYSWNFGDGVSSESTSSHVYNETGNFRVELTIEKEGCSATMIRDNYLSVEEADAAYLLSDSVFTCYPALVNFNHTGESSSISHGNWTYQEGIQSSTYSNTSQYTYTEPGIYTTSLSIVTNNGCTSTSSHTIEISGPTADYSISPTSLCSGDTVQFELGDTDGVEDYLWVFGDGSTSEEANPQHVYFAQGEVFPALILIQGECEVTLQTLPLRVSTINADIYLQPEQENYCLNSSMVIRNWSIDYTSSVWSVNGVQVATTRNLDLTFNQLGNTVIQLEVYNSFGCADTTERVVSVHPAPEFNISGDSLICQGDDIGELHVEAGQDWTIRWEPEALINNPEQFTITSSPDTTTQFTAIVTNDIGCEGTDTFLLHVMEPSSIQRIPFQDTSIFIGESIQLSVATPEKAQYSWSPDYNISCLDCKNPEVHPRENTVYICQLLGKCLDLSLEFPVEVVIDYYLELPRAFSPNGDGNNDFFIPELHNVADLDFKIYNRWGNLMFQTRDLNEGWDGNSAGKLQNPDTYVYVIRAVSLHGYEFEKKGTFILMR